MGITKFEPPPLYRPLFVLLSFNLSLNVRIWVNNGSCKASDFNNVGVLVQGFYELKLILYDFNFSNKSIERKYK